MTRRAPQGGVQPLGLLVRIDAATAPAVLAVPSGAGAGSHWLMDWSGCACPTALMQDANHLGPAVVAAARACGMQVVGERFHQFLPAGVTGAVLLAESHLTVHTWPELGFAALDVYVCDHTTANASKGHALVEALASLFQPAQRQTRHVHRQSLHGLPAQACAGALA